MSSEKAVVGFIGAGGIARSHAYSVNSLRYFYNDAPEVDLENVCSATPESRTLFAKRFGFRKTSDLSGFLSDKEINTVFILGPNSVHFEHFRAVLEMSSIKRIYLEKPVCSGREEEISMARLADLHPEIKIQIGFQYLFTASVRQALTLWKSGIFGNPIHFEVKYYHGDYLKKEYRDKRASRLVAAPDGGAMADLGSHGISLATAFLGEKLRIISALRGGHFSDVTEESDLFSSISLLDDATGAVGSISASRVSSGTGDSLSIELFAEKGSLKYSSVTPEYFEYYLEESGSRNRKIVGSDFRPYTGFPSEHVPPGWLRSMVHAHYVFLTGNDSEDFIPDIRHGLAVQRLVSGTAEQLKNFSKHKNP